MFAGSKSVQMKNA